VRRASLIAGAALALAGCPGDPPPDYVRIERITNAPPGSQASIANFDARGREIHEIELSLGVAVAALCWDSCEPDPACTLAKLTPADPSILGVRPVYRPGRPDGEFVLIASGAGTTTLHVQASCTSQTYEVTVLPP
jgi:hypothetical protein